MKAAAGRTRSISASSPVQAAFLVLGRFPPPAAGAHVLAGLDGARAGRTADRWIALRVQRIHRQGMLARVLPGLRLGPVGERIELDEAAVLQIQIDHRHLRASGRLLAAQARDPRRAARERARERLELADGAALLALGDAASEGEESFLALELLHRRAIGKVALDEDAVATPHLLHHLVGLGMEAAGVEREDAQTRRVASRQVDERDVFDTEAGSDARALAEAGVRPGQHLGGARARELPARFFQQIFLRHATSTNEKARLLRGGGPSGNLPSSCALLDGSAVPPQ